MAELDAKVLKNLDQTIVDMKDHLEGLNNVLPKIGANLRDTFGNVIVKEWRNELRGLKAERLIDAEKNVEEVNKIYQAFKTLQRQVQTGLKLEPVSTEQLIAFENELTEIELRLESIAGKRLKGQEWIDRKNLYDRRDYLRELVTSENPVVSVPMNKEEIAQAVELMKRYKELYDNIIKGQQQRAVELNNIQKAEKNEGLKEELQLNKEIEEEENKRRQESEAAAKERYKEAETQNKAWTKAHDAEEKARAKIRSGESKQAYREQTEAIRKQVEYQKQLITLRKEYVNLNAKKNRTDDENANLERIKGKIKEIINLSKQLDKEFAGTHSIARKATEYERFRQSIKGAKEETQKHNKSLEDMLPTLRRLASAFGVAFSVRGLAQFGRKLIETRGEFEMQFVAMKQIIGDVDAATKIWNQTMEQALKSPFKAMQLVDYTKKLAAYSIETEKLFDTTKRLADVSAGLGVDMGRLILAYGQVKAANFLRASEIRQFTEAGVNILGELAQYFSIVENRAVSTSDVMERVTKRMVLFSDVEAIFKRMTDEGGQFFNMQEVQANTVKGQIMKLHDAYDQMLNTIGQANQGTLRDMIDALNQMVRNWRDIASFIMKNVNALVILAPLIAIYRKGAKAAAGETFTWSRAMKQLEHELTFARGGVKKFSLSTFAGTAAVYAFKGAIELTKTALKTFVPFIAIEGLVWLITKMGAADRAAKELNKTLDNVGSQNVQTLQKNIDGFTKLKKELGKAAEGSQNYLDIRNKIQSQYGEYLDNLNAESITVDNLAASYDRVVERMREKSRQHIFEEGMQEITKAYGQAIVNFQNEVAKYSYLGISKEEAPQLAKKMYELYAQNEKYRGQKNPVMLLRDALAEYSGKTGLNYAQLSIGNDFYKAIETRFKAEYQLAERANALTRATTDTHEQYIKQLEIEEEHEKNINKIRNNSSIQSQGRRELALQAEELRYQEAKLELQAKYQKNSDDWLDKEKAKLKENYGAFLDAYNAQVKLYIGQRFKDANWMQHDNQEAWTAYNLMIATSDRLSQGQSKWEEHILGEKKLIEENIERIKEKQATQTATDAEAQKALNEELKRETERLELVKKQMELLGLHEKDKSGSGIYSDRIKLLQDMLLKYRQLAKEAYGYAKAEGKVAESFDDAWAKIMPAGYGELEVPTSYAALAEMLQRLEAFTPTIDKNGELSKQLSDLKKAIADALSQVDIEMSVRIREDFGREIEKMFSDYELTLNFESIGLPSDLAKNLFGIDTSSLDEISSYVQRFATEHAEDWNENINKIYADALKKISDKEQEQYKKDVSNLFKRVKNSADEMKTVMAQAAADINFADMLFDKQKAQKNINTITEQIEKNIEEINRLTPADGKATGVAAQQIARLEAENKILQNRVLRLSQMSGNLSAEQYTDLVRATMEHENEQLQKISLEQLKQLPEYIEAMGRTAGWSNEKLREMLDYLQNLISVSGGNIDITEYKSIINQIDKIQAEIKQNDYPFGREGFAKVAQMLQEQSEAEAKLNELTEERNQLMIEQKLLELEEIELQARLNELKAKGLDENSEEIQEIMEDIKSNQKFKTSNLIAQKKNAAGIQTITKGNAQTMVVIDAIIHGINNLVQEIYQNLKKVEILLQDYEVDTEHGKWAEWAKGMETFAKASQDATNGWEAYKKGDIAGIVYEVINGITDIWHGINEIANQKYVDTIYEMEQELERLTADYEKLQKAIEKTWDTSSYMMNYEKMVKNLEDQRKALQAQYDAEDARKNSDEEKMKEYQNSIRDIDETLTELKQKQIEVFGGLGEVNYRSAAQEFVDAWKEAFLETGDGLEGLKDHFDEFLQEWFVKQATMRIAGKMLQPLFEDIDKAVDQYNAGGTSVLMSELNAIREKFGIIAPQLSDALEALAGQWGLEGEGGLSGLAAGIQGMTEEQANVLEAYWNSTRGYVASIDMNVSRIVELLGSGAGRETNPQITYLESIARSSQGIYGLLSEAFKSGHNKGGIGLKVFVE